MESIRKQLFWTYPVKVSNTRPSVKQYDWRGINFPPGQKD